MNDPAIWGERAKALSREGRHAEAEETLGTLDADALCDLGVSLAQEGDHTSAEHFFRRATELRPNGAKYHFNLGVVLQRQGRASAACRAYANAWRLKPDLPGLALSYGNVLLATGDLEAGWRLYDQRPERLTSEAHKLGFPEWRGESLAGKRLFIWVEQGYGDQILAARYLARIDAAAITLCCPPALSRLFSQLPVNILERQPQTPVEPHDYWTLPLSLPGTVGGPLWSGAYLRCPCGPTAGFGVMWRGNSLPDPGRSLPAGAANQLLSLPGARSLDPEDTGARDFQDTADLIAGLDFVISIDTSVAHLAGAMGKPVWLMLQQHAIDWRWELPWYPKVKIIRQGSPGDWTSVVEQVTAEIGQSPSCPN